MSSRAVADPAALVAEAERVLRANWRGSATVPSRTQYPHQWSWDAAFAALGWAWLDEERGFRELASLLRAQWADGRVPHIVFNPSVSEDAYFPGPGFWRSVDVPGAPRDVATSGLVQPPLHARAALEVALHARDGEAARRWLRRLLPALVAQHRHLEGARDIGGGGLAALVHPWESGLDDSPAWDAPLAAVAVPAEGVAPYERRDLRHVDAVERPTSAWYDRFVLLARAYRDAGYADEDLAERAAFLVEDPLFNAIRLWSTHALAEIAARVGEDPGPHREAAARQHEALLARLWDPGTRRFLARDLLRGERLHARTVSGLVPLLDPDLPADVVAALAADLASPHFTEPTGGIGVASSDLLGPEFDPRRYWRGPVWANLNWLLAHGLRTHGRTSEAAAVEATVLRLVATSGLREYFDPLTGEGRGSGEFSWTSAVVIDLVRSGAVP
jgi:glycogen debranching enzyme